MAKFIELTEEGQEDPILINLDDITFIRGTNDYGYVGLRSSDAMWVKEGYYRLCHALEERKLLIRP